MDQKVYYISDWHVAPGNYTFERHRYPQAYIELGPWYILNFKDIDTEIKGTGNLIIANTPVHDELRKLHLINNLMADNEVYIGIEGSVWDWCDWPAAEQQLYVEMLAKADGVVVSNLRDMDMLRAFATKFIQASPCTNRCIEAPREHLGEYVFLVNPSKRYQRGMVSHKLVYDSVPRDLTVYTIGYRRPANFNELLSFPDSYVMPGFKLVAYMEHDQFMATVYNARFGVDIHRDYSAGTVSVDFGSVGVPLVGNLELDTQREIFPDTSFEWCDYDSIKKCINLLSKDRDFCLEVGAKALQNTKQKYGSELVVRKFMEDLSEMRKLNKQN
jgi:hypothetical protein